MLVVLWISLFFSTFAFSAKASNATRRYGALQPHGINGSAMNTPQPDKAFFRVNTGVETVTTRSSDEAHAIHQLDGTTDTTDQSYLVSLSSEVSSTEPSVHLRITGANTTPGFGSQQVDSAHVVNPYDENATRTSTSAFGLNLTNHSSTQLSFAQSSFRRDIFNESFLGISLSGPQNLTLGILNVTRTSETSSPKAPHPITKAPLSTDASTSPTVSGIDYWEALCSYLNYEGDNGFELFHDLNVWPNRRSYLESCWPVTNSDPFDCANVNRASVNDYWSWLRSNEETLGPYSCSDCTLTYINQIYTTPTFTLDDGYPRATTSTWISNDTSIDYGTDTSCNWDTYRGWPSTCTTGCGHCTLGIPAPPSRLEMFDSPYAPPVPAIDARIVFWAPADPSPATDNTSEIKRSVVIDGYSYVSPTSYLSIKSIIATDTCGIVGHTYSDVVLPLTEGEISTIGLRLDEDDLRTRVTESLNVSVLAEPIPASTWIAQYKCWPILCDDLSDPGCWNWDCHAIVNTLYEPVLVIPPSVKSLDPAWADCFFDSSGMPDPPYALTAVDQAVMPPGMGAPKPTPLPADPSAMPAKPGSTAGDGLPVKTYSGRHPTATHSPVTDNDGSDPSQAHGDDGVMPVPAGGHSGDDTYHSQAAAVSQSSNDDGSYDVQDPQNNVGQKPKSHRDPPHGHQGPPYANPLGGTWTTSEDLQGSQPLMLIIPGLVQDPTANSASPTGQLSKRIYLMHRSPGGSIQVFDHNVLPGGTPYRVGDISIGVAADGEIWIQAIGQKAKIAEWRSTYGSTQSLQEAVGGAPMIVPLDDPLREVTVGGLRFVRDPSGSAKLYIDGEVIAPGGDPVAISGHTILVDAAGRHVLIDGKSFDIVDPTSDISKPTRFSTNTIPHGSSSHHWSMASVFSLGASLYTADPSHVHAYTMDGQTLMPGGQALTISGTIVSLAGDGSFAFVVPKTEDNHRASTIAPAIGEQDMGSIIMSGFGPDATAPPESLTVTSSSINHGSSLQDLLKRRLSHLVLVLIISVGWEVVIR